MLHFSGLSTFEVHTTNADAAEVTLKLQNSQGIVAAAMCKKSTKIATKYE